MTWIPWRRGRAFVPLFVGAVAIAASALQTVVYGPLAPAYHDEFSYLLAADTFLHGRCTNPTHRLWPHFETMHVLQRPSYASKYPPGQGLFLAAGRLLGGHPIVGVWLGVGLACGAVTWMLLAFLPARWALVGGLLMASRMGFGEWGYSYMGGGVAAAGGGLFIGGWFRALRRPHWLPSAVMALGLAILAISRPFEGLLLCVPVGVATVVWLARRRPPMNLLVNQFLAPALAVLMPAAVALGYYNARVTGHFYRLPYMEHAAQYDVAPVLLIQHPYPEPKYRHATLREFHAGFELGDYQSQQTFAGWLKRVRAKLHWWWDAYLGYGLTLPLLALPWIVPTSSRTRFALAACLFVFGVVATLETWGAPHYTAPVAGLLYFLVAQGFRRIALARSMRRPAGRWVLRGWIASCFLIPTISLFPRIHEPTLEWVYSRAPLLLEDMRTWFSHRPAPLWASKRESVGSILPPQGGRHLIIVHYGPGYSFHEDLVYNEADIDGAQVVWARDMGPERQAMLLDYFPDRTVWRLEADVIDGRNKGEMTKLRDPIKPGWRSPMRER